MTMSRGVRDICWRIGTKERERSARERAANAPQRREAFAERSQAFEGGQGEAGRRCLLVGGWRLWLWRLGN